jgi:tripartite-type tricarboxylate transporter receptor subunit TctC
MAARFRRPLENAMKNSRVRAKFALPFCVLLACAAQGWAQTYPAKVVRYIVPMSAGSGADTIGRIAATGLTQVFGQQVIVDNRTGAAGNIGADAAAKAPGDGYTLFQASSTHAANATLYKSLPYDLVRDFAPVTQLASSPSILVVHPSLPVKTVGDLVRLAKAKPGAINYASTGVGSATWAGAELFKDMAGIDLLHVPYRGGGESLTAVIAGEVSVYFAAMAVALPQIRQGRLRALAVTTAKRVPLLPDQPTIAESGYPGYENGNWYGIVAPAKTPKEIVSAINRAALAALKEASISNRLSELGYISVGDQPDQFATFIKSEVATLAKVIKRSGAKIE